MASQRCLTSIADETKNIVPMARALIGNRSAVVVKTPSGDVKARAIPAGNIELQSQGRTLRVDVAAGADAIMKAVGECPKLDNVTGEAGTNIGGMLEHVRQTMAELTNKPSNETFHPGFAGCRHLRSGQRYRRTGR